jgi:copper chaperone CopZ
MELAQQYFKEIAAMEELVLGVPAMYADHHVLAVRDALLSVDGVDDVQASAAFKTVKVTFDANQASAQIIAMALQDVGYPPAGFSEMGNGHVPISTGKKDPGWASLNMRTVETHPAELGAVR